MGVKLVSSGGGSVEINPPATASNFVATMPAGTGTVAVQGVSSNIVSGTVVTVSGTSVDFTGIPSWVRRVTVMLNGVSTNGTSNFLLQFGSGSIIASGYDSAASSFNSINTSSGIGFLLTAGNLVVASSVSGAIVLNLFNPSTNTWVSSGNLANTTNVASNGSSHLSAGNRALSGALDRVRITTVNGTDTFDAGSINILYE